MTHREMFAEEIKKLASKYSMTFQDISQSLVLIFNEKQKKKKGKLVEPAVLDMEKQCQI